MLIMDNEQTVLALRFLQSKVDTPVHIEIYFGGIQSISIGCGKWFGLA